LTFSLRSVKAHSPPRDCLTAYSLEGYVLVGSVCMTCGYCQLCTSLCLYPTPSLLSSNGLRVGEPTWQHRWV